MTKARTIADLGTGFVNITDTGTEGTKVASGTTAQRGSTTGQFRFNTTTGLAEYFDGSSFRSIDSPPIVTSINTTNFESSALPTNVVITGNNFATAVSVKFIGNDGTETSAGTTTRDSASQITAQIPNTITSANEPYDVKVTNTTSNLAGTLADAFNIDAAPAFSTASGSLGTLQDANRAGSNLTTVAATDDEGDSITFSVTSGSIPAGLTFNSNGTFSGTANAVTSNTTSTFTVTASDGTNTSTRQFTVTVNAPDVQGGTTQDYTIGSTNYRSHTFLSSGTLTITTSKTVDYLIVGGGSSHNIVSSTGGGGGGAGGFRTFTSVSLSPGTYTATVGQGGSAGVSANNGALCQNGGDTSFNSQTATGGGRGGARNQSSPGDDTTAFNAASNGGSGGGAGYDYPNNPGSGNTPSTSPSQGNNGGIGYGSGSTGGSGYAGGGGGGSGSVGANHSGGNGGTGTQNNYRTGSNQYYAAGGGGGAGAGSNNGNGGSSIGGNGGNDSYSATSPTQNTGSGGGGCGGPTNSRQATAGADGIIVIRYQI